MNANYSMITLISILLLLFALCLYKLIRIVLSEKYGLAYHNELHQCSNCSAYYRKYQSIESLLLAGEVPEEHEECCPYCGNHENVIVNDDSHALKDLYLAKELSLFAMIKELRVIRDMRLANVSNEHLSAINRTQTDKVLDSLKDKKDILGESLDNLSKIKEDLKRSEEK